MYPGDGARYDVHVDNDAHKSVPSLDKRVLTAVLYLNDAWNASRDGYAAALARLMSLI